MKNLETVNGITVEDAIRNRHSVRSYDKREIDEETASKLRLKIEELNKEGDLHLQFLSDAGKAYNRLMNKFMGLDSAPSVIACVGRDDDTLSERVGYFGEQLVLYAQQLGLNTCWTGTFNKKTQGIEVNEGEKLEIFIAIGYGTNSGKPHKCKDFSQIVSGKEERPDWFLNGVEFARLAPTAINQQKYRIVLHDDDTVEIQDLGGPFSKVDLGIVTCHFEIGSGVEVFGK